MEYVKVLKIDMDACITVITYKIKSIFSFSLPRSSFKEN